MPSLKRRQHRAESKDADELGREIEIVRQVEIKKKKVRVVHQTAVGVAPEEM